MSESGIDEFEDYDEVEGISGFVVLIIGTVVLAVFCLSIFLAYQHGMRSAGTQLPRIAADPNPVKSERELSLGNRQDREVFDQLEGAAPSQIVIAAEASADPLSGFTKVTSAAEDIEAAGEIEAESAPGKAKEAADAANAANAARKADVAPSTGNADARRAVASSAETASPAANVTPRPKPAHSVKQAGGAVATQPDKKPSATGQGEAATPPKSITEVLAAERAGTTQSPDRNAQNAQLSTSKSTIALGGSHLVQVAAFRSEADAQTHYTKLKEKFGAIVANKAMHVERTDLKDKGIYYRLRLGPFASEDAATSYCARLKNGGQDCLVKPL